MNDRIKLAEAMGGKVWEAYINPNVHPEFVELPDPFTDANDDYAVLEWMRETRRAGDLADALHHLIIIRRDPTVENSANYGLNVEDVVTDYQIGDYARAALKAIK